MTDDETTPAQNLDAEQALLGALLLDPKRAAGLADELEGRDFYQPAHETIWHAALTIAADPDRGLDPITLKDELERCGALARVGGAAYLHTLMQACAIPGNASHYAGLIRDAARLRTVAETAARLKQVAEKADPDAVDEALARAVDTLDEAASRFGPTSRSHQYDGRPHRTGAAFILDSPARVPVVWGTGDEVIWAEGEAFMVVGPQGVGKSTLIQQIVRGRLGIGDGLVLGHPIAPGEGRVLYLACDRPQQISRSMRRMFTEDDRAALDDRLIVWEGPPPHDFAKHTSALLDMCEAAHADTVIIDSLKDVALGLREDEIGAAYNRARQTALTAGVQVLEAHHQTKRGAGGQGKPETLADVYGSVWLTAGAGSVVLLWGNAGDPIVELKHLKQPADPVGPIKLIHDHTTGTSSVWHSTDLLLIARSLLTGLTAKAAAAAMFGTDKPSSAEIEKARRRLEAMTRQGHLTKHDGDPATATPAAYHPAGRLPIGLTA